MELWPFHRSPPLPDRQLGIFLILTSFQRQLITRCILSQDTDPTLPRRQDEGDNLRQDPNLGQWDKGYVRVWTWTNSPWWWMMEVAQRTLLAHSAPLPALKNSLTGQFSGLKFNHWRFMNLQHFLFPNDLL